MNNSKGYQKGTEGGATSVRLEGITKTFGSVVAVDGLTLEIESGEFLTLLGPSGSGKTTTLRIISGFEHPTEGEVLIGDTPVTYIPPHRREVGLVFQNYALFPHMTVFDNVAFALRMRRMSRKEIERRVAATLELVQLEGYGNRLPKQLSGGQQQRVAVARALVFNPSVLLLDEPLGALDKKLRESMQIELKQMHRKLTTTMIYVTHDQQEALVMSDRIAVMNEGRIEQLGSPVEIYENPANRFVADFIGLSNFLIGRVTAVAEGECAVETADGCMFRLPAVDGLALDESVIASLRPEKLFFITGTDIDASCSLFEGEVTESIYLGEATLYQVDIGARGKLEVKQQNREGMPTYRIGDRVRVGCRPGDINVVS